MGVIKPEYLYWLKNICILLLINILHLLEKSFSDFLFSLGVIMQCNSVENPHIYYLLDSN